MSWEALRAYQDSLLESLAVGTDLAVYQGEEPAYRHMNGFADRDAGKKVSGDTLFRVYSMTKPITCALALILHDQGCFLMTDPVSRWLPAFENMRVKDGGTVRDARKPLRVLDLFTMTSGLNYELERDSLKAAVLSNGPGITMAQAVDALAGDSLDFDPGERFCYGVSHDVLGLLVEALCGASLGECLKEMVFGPLGMKNSFFEVPEPALGRMAVTYASQPPFGQDSSLDQLFRAFPRLESGGGGLVMTTDDYLLFLRMLLREGRNEEGLQLLSPAAVRLMRANHLTGDVHAGYMAERPGYGYGLGVRVLTHPEMIGALTHPGEFGWAGAQGTWMMVDPTSKVTAVFMMQGAPGPNREIHPKLRNIIAAQVH
ncbi:MAG: serine hydrolase [Eubacteriales bacterium]|nr:serine hydrolase [Eubacteriales bacterium]